MNTITVENTQYEFQEVPGKGKCLVPVRKMPDSLHEGQVFARTAYGGKEYAVLVIGQNAELALVSKSFNRWNDYPSTKPGPRNPSQEAFMNSMAKDRWEYQPNIKAEIVIK